MLQIPRTVMARFEDCLAANNISENLRGQYKENQVFTVIFKVGSRGKHNLAVMSSLHNMVWRVG